jgi:hypothetical protein
VSADTPWRSAAAPAKASARSFPGTPLCPFTPMMDADLLEKQSDRKGHLLGQGLPQSAVLGTTMCFRWELRRAASIALTSASKLSALCKYGPVQTPSMRGRSPASWSLSETPTLWVL